MTCTPQQARKEIFKRLKECWDARSPAVTDEVPEVRYQGEEKPNAPKKDKFWLRASTQGVTTRQAAHTTPADAQSQVVFESRGVFMGEVFAPMATGAYAKGELLAAIVQGAFMAAETPCGVWFRNPRINELPNDGTWYRWLVIVDLQFNQVKGA